jgi:DNA (cytosine-5)-methyltransferase 1
MRKVARKVATSGFDQSPSGVWKPATLTSTYSGIAVPSKVRRPIALDFFAGCGGFSLGLMRAGWEVIAGFDHDLEAALTYACNLGAYGKFQWHFATEADEKRTEKALLRKMKQVDGVWTLGVRAGCHFISEHPELVGVSHFFLGDVRQWSGDVILAKLGLQPGDIDLVVGGPPCQGFSVAGKQNVMDPRNSLVFEFARLIVELQPQTMCMENVPGIVNMVTPEGVRVIDQFCLILEQGDFGTVDALKRTLLGNPNARAAIRTRRSEAQKRSEAITDDAEGEDEQAPLQLEMAL